MELFKFNYTTDPTVLERGQVINKAKTVSWTERYREPGEFKIEAPLSSNLNDFLPLGTLISHTDTMEVMIVENHEVTEKFKEDPTLVITGRSFETILENRMAGANLVRASVYVSEYIIPAANTWDQAVELINAHIVGQTWDSGHDNLGNVSATTIIGGTGLAIARTIAVGSVHQRLMELLAVDDLGIQTVRRNTFGGLGSSTQTLFYIHAGSDKTKKVIFSWESGDMDSIEYLFSDKKNKTSALIMGRYCWQLVDTVGFTGYNRRMLLVDGSDIDDYLDTKPDGSTFPAITQKMRTRGYQALADHNRVTISRADISRTTQYRYRVDYDVGDLITLEGSFGASAIMRVVEYVEIEDENGESGHPTLSIPGA